MQKKTFFNKLTLSKKDYNNMLENVLEHKKITAEAKNLLLSMLYKIEINYKDYEIVKREVVQKNVFIETIIETISSMCENIILVEPNSEIGKAMAKTDDVAIVEGKTITSYPTEFALFVGICNLTKTNFNVSSEYKILEKSIKKVLEHGYIENLKEIITNFDGWTWNIQNLSLESAMYNLLYQNLQFIAGNKFIEEWKSDTKTEIDYIEKLNELIENLYSGELQKKFYEALQKILLKIEINDFPENFKNYLNDLDKYKEELDLLLDTASYLSNISKQKQEINKKIDTIDKILSDKELLQEEYNSRNNKLSFDKKIFNIKHLIETLKKERNDLFLEIRNLNNLIDPNVYLKNKEVLQEKVTKYSELKELFENKEPLLQQIIQFQLIFLKLLEKKLEKAITKKELVNLIYILRYYKNIRLEKNKSIKDYEELRNPIATLERTVILKAINSDVFFKFTEDALYLVDIISEILNAKIINFEEINLLIKEQENGNVLEVYDGEILEEKISLSKEIKLSEHKRHKKIKLFN